MRRIVTGTAFALAAVALTACSQVASLTPVSGASLTSVRNAANDVLFEQGVPILVAPKCRPVDTGFTCIGSTVDGAEILVMAEGNKPFAMSISVGGAVVFEGNATDVLASAVQEAS